MDKTPPVTAANATANLARGAAWALAMRWSVRGMGLISTGILARFLKPEDYGLIGMAFLVVGLLEAFLNVGAPQALIRLGQTGSREHTDSAWVLRAMQGVLIGVVLALAAPWASVFFEEPRLTPVLWVLAACLAAMGFSNIGMALAYRDLQYKTEFKQIFFTKLVSMGFTFASVAFFMDYRALLTGLVAGYVAEFCLSYKLHPYRPRWCVSKVQELWHVSKWLLATGLGGYLLSRFDHLVAGKVGTTHQYGLYTVGNDIGTLAAGEIGGTLARPLFPTLANLKHDWPAAEKTTLNLIETIAYLVLPLGVGLAMVSPEATLVMLGPQWTAAAPFMAGFALVGAVLSCLAPLGTLLAVAGYVKSETTAVWAEFVVFAILTLLLVQPMGLIGLVFARAGGAVVKACVLLWRTQANTNLGLRRLYQALQNPVLAASAMAAVLYAHPWPTFDNPVIELTSLVLWGGTVYTGSCLLLWWGRGKPDGFVAYVLGKLLTNTGKA